MGTGGGTGQSVPDEDEAGAASSDVARRASRSEARITAGQRQRFLNALTLTCDVQRAAEDAGGSLAGLYQLRRRDAEFAQQWRGALDAAYDRLEALVLEHVGAALPLTGDPERLGVDGVEPAVFEYDKAMRVLASFRGERAGAKPRAAALPVGNASREETNAALHRALSAAARRQAKREAAAPPEVPMRPVRAMDRPA